MKMDVKPISEGSKLPVRGYFSNSCAGRLWGLKRKSITATGEEKRTAGSWLVQSAVRVCFLVELHLVAVSRAKPFKHAKHVAKRGIQKYWSVCFEVKLEVLGWESQ